MDERKRKILLALVHNYILNAEPVGSKTLVERYHLGMSPATVRNEMAQLERMGYLYQPHPSAGRMPTDEAYRFYVDSLKGGDGLSEAEKRSVGNYFAILHREVDEVLHRTSDILAELTSYVAVVLAPPFRQTRIKHVDLVLMSPTTALLVLISSTGSVAKRVVNLGSPVNPAKLAELEAMLQEKAVGKAFDQINEERAEFYGMDFEPKGLVGRIVDELLSCMAEEERNRVYMGGTANLLEQPEFGDPATVRPLLEVLERSYLLLSILGEALEARSVLVRIGTENHLREIQHMSLVAAGYHVGEDTYGTVGLLGPTRMNYGRAISAVQCIAANLSKALEAMSS